MNLPLTNHGYDHEEANCLREPLSSRCEPQILRILSQEKKCISSFDEPREFATRLLTTVIVIQPQPHKREAGGRYHKHTFA